MPALSLTAHCPLRNMHTLLTQRVLYPHIQAQMNPITFSNSQNIRIGADGPPRPREARRQASRQLGTRGHGHES